jgi:hypothetical protein
MMGLFELKCSSIAERAGSSHWRSLSERREGTLCDRFWARSDDIC